MKQLIPVAFQYGSKIAPEFSAKVALHLFLKPTRTPRTKKEVEIWKKGEPYQFRSGRSARIYGSSGPLLFFVHGWEGRGSQWYRFVAPAIEKGYRVLLWDGPAHGDSPGKKANAILFARSIVEDLVELDETPHAMIGHSMGGAAASLLPHFSVFVPRMVTISAPTLIQGVFDRYFDLIRLNHVSRKRVIEMMAETTGFTIHKASFIHSPLQANQKVLLIHDENDKEIPYSDFTEMKKVHPEFSFSNTQGLGHRRILYSNDVVNQVIDFVSGE